MLLEVKKLNASFDKKKILHDISFEIDGGSFVVLLGANNSGKTVLIKHLLGFMQSDNNIILDNITLNKDSGKDYIINIGYVGSDFLNMFVSDNCYDELAAPLNNLNYSNSAIEKRLNYLYTTYNLENISNSSLSELTNLDKLKIQILSSISHKPKILYLDDIFRNIDKADYSKLSTFLKAIVEKEKISVFMTSDSISSTRYADRVMVLDNGSIILDDSLDNIIKKDSELVKLGIKMDPVVDTSIQLMNYDLLNRVYFDSKEMVDDLWN